MTKHRGKTTKLPNCSRGTMTRLIHFLLNCSAYGKWLSPYTTWNGIWHTQSQRGNAATSNYPEKLIFIHQFYTFRDYMGLTNAKNGNITSHASVPRKKTCSLTDLVGYCEGRTPGAFLPKPGPSADLKYCCHQLLLSPFFIKTSELCNA